MNDNLIEKCLLTNRETSEAINKYPTHALDGRYQISDREMTMIIRVQNAVLEKALPIIQQASREQVKEILRGIKQETSIYPRGTDGLDYDTVYFGKLTESSMDNIAEAICSLPVKKMDGRFIPEKTYWEIKSIIKGIVLKQESEDVSWETTPMAVLQKLNELEKDRGDR